MIILMLGGRCRLIPCLRHGQRHKQHGTRGRAALPGLLEGEHALPGMGDGADGLGQQHAQLLAVLEHLDGPKPALIQPLIHAEMLAQAMIMIMAEWRAM